jgi:hypothetical protein
MEGQSGRDKIVQMLILAGTRACADRRDLELIKP